jgi:hypothetical protein
VFPCMLWPSAIMKCVFWTMPGEAINDPLLSRRSCSSISSYCYSHR